MDGKPLRLDLTGPSVHEGDKLWEYAVLVTDAAWTRASITSRPLLLAAVGKVASHANQTTLHLTPLHGRADMLRKRIANIGEAVQHVKASAEQFKDQDRWGCLLRYISDRLGPVIGPTRPSQGLSATG